MLLPSKVTPYAESVLAQLPVVLEMLDERAMSPCNLLAAWRRKKGSLADFYDVLDCLYALRAIDFDEAKGVICRAGRDLV